MNKLEYIAALKRALAGLPPETIAKTLAYYEQRFVDGVALGRSEAEIAADLGAPAKIAVTLRASAHMGVFEQKKNPANFMRMLVSALGLAIFNLFMVVPALVYSAMLAVMYMAALVFYVGGIAITASGLSGANELVLDGPLRHFVIRDSDRAPAQGDGATQTRIEIGASTIDIFDEPSTNDAGDGARDGAGDEAGNPALRNGKGVIRRAEAFAGHGIHISTDPDGSSRTTQTTFGMAMVMLGIALFLLSLVVTTYTVSGIKRYMEMNFALLRGR